MLVGFSDDNRREQLRIFNELRKEMNGMLSAVVTFALPRIVNVTVTGDTLSIDLEDGRTISVPIGWYPRLAHGNPAERARFHISGAGYGIYWLDLDIVRDLNVNRDNV